ncbi:hypothetical protein C8R47DRAFT_1082538 [Mycena vitilis]|nr:hypothetical protein C8R47DRAFT_1082538 [Mycena vitilis]
MIFCCRPQEKNRWFGPGSFFVRVISAGQVFVSTVQHTRQPMERTLSASRHGTTQSWRCFGRSREKHNVNSERKTLPVNKGISETPTQNANWKPTYGKLCASGTSRPPLIRAGSVYLFLSNAEITTSGRLHHVHFKEGFSALVEKQGFQIRIAETGVPNRIIRSRTQEQDADHSAGLWIALRAPTGVVAVRPRIPMILVEDG